MPETRIQIKTEPKPRLSLSKGVLVSRTCSQVSVLKAEISCISFRREIMRQSKNSIKPFPSSLYTYSVHPRRQKCYREHLLCSELTGCTC